MIHDLNDQVRDAIYNSDWLAAEVELRKMMIMVMCYTHRPLTLKTGIYKEASLVVFTTVIKMSFSYFNVLRAVNTT
uniref:Odorant receptor 12 n=1 Tax=Drosicha corpulenta TaxID=535978 RepID=A0A0U3T5Q9_9HEMI|nr:odorant receptor 12 [Drosicha corpulenta]